MGRGVLKYITRMCRGRYVRPRWRPTPSAPCGPGRGRRGCVHRPGLPLQSLSHHHPTADDFLPPSSVIVIAASTPVSTSAAAAPHADSPVADSAVRPGADHPPPAEVSAADEDVWGEEIAQRERRHRPQLLFLDPPAVGPQSAAAAVAVGGQRGGSVGTASTLGLEVGQRRGGALRGSAVTRRSTCSVEGMCGIALGGAPDMGVLRVSWRTGG